MSSTRPEKFSKLLCKGYLIYPADPVINGLFLSERSVTKYKILMDNTSVSQYNIPSRLIQELNKIGTELSVTKVPVTTGKKSVFGIAVQVRKIREKKKFVYVMIRVDGKNIGEVDDKIQKIQIETRKFFSHKPKTCMWDKLTPDKIIINEPVSQQLITNDIGVLDEVKKLRNKVEDLQDDVQSMHKTKLQRMISDTRDVQQGILK